MDLRRLVIDPKESRVDVVVADAQGEEERDLSGQEAHEVLVAAEPAWAVLAARHLGEPVWLSLDAAPGQICVRFAGEGHVSYLLLNGPDYEQVLPALREAARIAVRKARPRKADPGDVRSDAELWEHKYRRRSDGWELMRAAPPLERWFDQHPPAPLASALVPGCGRGHEARLLARHGARVLAIDIAPTAVEETTRLAEAEGLTPLIEVKQADLFDLPRSLSESQDLVVEHCCFCAVDPKRREEYVHAVADLLRPGGQFVGLFWCHGEPGGPPYASTQQEVERRFAARFDLVHAEVPRDSIVTRAGQELLLVLTRR